MKYPLISEVLHLAADKYLAVDYDDEQNETHFDQGKGYDKERYSCCAVSAAMNELTKGMDYPMYRKLENQVLTGLQNMGCNTDSTNAFHALEKKSGYNRLATKESQGARYFWLKWAALMAENQGI